MNSKLLISCIFCASAFACATQAGSPAIIAAAASSNESWHCAENNGEWFCKPRREHSENYQSTSVQTPQLSHGATHRPDPESDSVSEYQFAPEPLQPRQPEFQNTDNSSMPEYLSLAYKPSETTLLTNLPESFSAVQLVAHGSESALTNFVQTRSFEGLSAAKIMVRDKIYYVVLLGVYETRAIAERAAAARPAAVADLEPYIRSMASLQRAIRAAAKPY